VLVWCLGADVPEAGTVADAGGDAAEDDGRVIAVGFFFSLELNVELGSWVGAGGGDGVALG